MTQIYGHRWLSSYGEEVDRGNVWRAVLKNISELQMKSGLNELINSNFDWPPSAIEFRKLCLKSRERELGVLSAHEAFVELTKWVNSASRDITAFTPFLFNVYKRVGSFNLLNRSSSELKVLISEACQLVSEKVNRGEALDALPEQKHEAVIAPIRATQEQASSAMSEIRKLWS